MPLPLAPIVRLPPSTQDAPWPETTTVPLAPAVNPTQPLTLRRPATPKGSMNSSPDAVLPTIRSLEAFQSADEEGVTSPVARIPACARETGAPPATANTAASTAARDRLLPRPLACSLATCQRPVRRLKTMRYVWFIALFCNPRPAEGIQADVSGIGPGMNCAARHLQLEKRAVTLHITETG
ncbi:hypothetical protein D9M72_232510 [compost metagenome]